MEDDFAHLKEVIDSDGTGYLVDRYLHSETIHDEYLSDLVNEVETALAIIETYIKRKAIEQASE